MQIRHHNRRPAVLLPSNVDGGTGNAGIGHVKGKPPSGVPLINPRGGDPRPIMGSGHQWGDLAASSTSSHICYDDVQALNARASGLAGMTKPSRLTVRVLSTGACINNT